MENSSNRGASLILPTIILGLCLVAGTFVVAAAVYKVKALNRTLSVTGSVDRVVKSDTVKWRCHFSRSMDANGLQTGSKELQADLKAVLAYLKANGVAAEAITVNPADMSLTCYSTQGWYDTKSCGPNPIAGYNLTQALVIESADVEGITKLAQEATGALIDQGTIFASDGLEYYYGKLADLRLEMLADATKNAKARAETIAASTGTELGPIQSASMGVFQVTAVNSMEISDYGAYDTSTIDKKVTAVVRAGFALQ